MPWSALSSFSLLAFRPLTRRDNPGKMVLSSWVTLIGTVFDGIPCVGTVIADPGARFRQVVCIRMPA
jgi:hypothetical protein